jgi:hypothetical protein
LYDFLSGNGAPDLEVRDCYGSSQQRLTTSTRKKYNIYLYNLESSLGILISVEYDNSKEYEEADACKEWQESSAG